MKTTKRIKQLSQAMAREDIKKSSKTSKQNM